MSASFDRYRTYLGLLARAHLPAALRGRVDASDLVQQTLLEAHRDQEQRRGRSDDETVGWLRRILGNRILNAIRDARREKRDPRLERRLDDDATRVASRLVSPDPSPSEAAMRKERVLAIAVALEALPAEQQEIVTLRFLAGWKLEEIAAHLDRSVASVAGLLYRGVAALGTKLRREDEP